MGGKIASVVGIVVGALCVVAFLVLIIFASVKQQRETNHRLYAEPMQREAIARGFATYEIQPDGSAKFVWNTPARSPHAPRPDFEPAP